MSSCKLAWNADRMLFTRIVERNKTGFIKSSTSNPAAASEAPRVFPSLHRRAEKVAAPVKQESQRSKRDERGRAPGSAAQRSGQGSGQTTGQAVGAAAQEVITSVAVRPQG